MAPFQPFQLSAELSAHGADVRPPSLSPATSPELSSSARLTVSAVISPPQVRSVFSPSASLIVSSSRDKSAIAWVRGTDGWTLGKHWQGLGGFVGAAWAGVVDGTSCVPSYYPRRRSQPSQPPGSSPARSG